MSTVIVLNASYEPLGVVPLHRAMMYLVRERASIVEAVPGLTMRSATVEYLIPRVVQFREMVRVPYRYRPETWSRRGVLTRDGHVCAFCGMRAGTVDHIMPKSRTSNPDTWMNTVAACSPCNSRKGARTPAEAGMPLRFQPREVTSRDTLLLAMASTGADLVGLGLA
jgi:5-methylcytosine-specific restriction endonuclease McrA